MAVLSGIIAGAAALGGAAIANKGASNAAKATTQAADTAAQVQRENYDRSAAALAPWQQSGLAANSAINALLGLPTQQPSNVGQFAQPNALTQFQPTRGGFAGLNDYMRYRNAPQPTAQPTPQVNQQQAYQNAFDNYRNSTGYQFRLNQGLDAVNSGYAGAGTIKSGAAMKAVNDYGQGMASQEFANYLASLGNQQSIGYGATAAQAGVGANTANSLADIATNQGQNLAAIYSAKSQNTANALTDFSSILAKQFGKKGA